MRLGPFELVEEIGSGTFGSVWTARHADEPEADFAIKVLARWALNRDGEERFRDELQVLEELRHPHVVTVEASGVVPPMRALPGGAIVVGAPWFAMRRAVGTLADPGVRPSALIPALESLLQALAIIHAHGVVHGDLSPGNLLVFGDGRVCISDFGAAYFLAEDRGGGLATRRYAAPELEWGPPTPLSDLYALGRIADELLRPEDGGRVRAWTVALCAEDPADRPSSAADALRALRVARGDQQSAIALEWYDVWGADAAEHPIWSGDAAPRRGKVLTAKDAGWLRVTRSACRAGATVVITENPRGPIHALREAVRTQPPPDQPPSRRLRIALAAPPMTVFESDTTRFKRDSLLRLVGRHESAIALLAAGHADALAEVSAALPCWLFEKRIATEGTFDPEVLAMLHVLGGRFDAEQLRALSAAFGVPFSHAWLRELRELALIRRDGDGFESHIDGSTLDSEILERAWSALAALESERPTEAGLARLGEAGKSLDNWSTALALGSQFDAPRATALGEALLGKRRRDWLRARLELAELCRSGRVALPAFADRLGRGDQGWDSLLAFDAAVLAGNPKRALELATQVRSSREDPLLRAASTLACARALLLAGDVGAAADECIRATERFRRLDDGVHVALCQELHGHLLVAIGSVMRGQDLLSTAASELARRGAGYPALRAIAAAQAESFTAPAVLDPPTNALERSPLAGR